MPALYAGIGCRRGCPVQALDQLVHEVLALHGLQPKALRGIASIASKADEPGLQQLATRYHLPLVLFEADQLHAFQAQLSHHSAVAFAQTGCWGVAESAALALASLGHAHANLRVTRQVLGPATLALACGE
ncbi:cobalamin biosynthesis protein [Pseudomonas promysalinigenes]|uniref:cobalamin biosynthesis protein n=1 Tax=Pseudomonas promysalinigenes TaxID=485898 RepID=UPI0037CA1B26